MQVLAAGLQQLHLELSGLALKAIDEGGHEGGAALAMETGELIRGDCPGAIVPEVVGLPDVWMRVAATVCRHAETDMATSEEGLREQSRRGAWLREDLTHPQGRARRSRLHKPHWHRSRQDNSGSPGTP